MDQLICASLSHTHYLYEVGHVESTDDRDKDDCSEVSDFTLLCENSKPLRKTSLYNTATFYYHLQDATHCRFPDIDLYR